MKVFWTFAVFSLGMPCAVMGNEKYRHPYYPQVALSEDERLRSQAKRNHTWPIQKFVPDTEGWANLMKSRIGQVTELEEPVSHSSYVTLCDQCGMVLCH